MFADYIGERVHLGLVRRINVGVKDGVGGKAKYWPLCSEKYFPMPKHLVELPFDPAIRQIGYELLCTLKP
jgi:hypothetical protein